MHTGFINIFFCGVFILISSINTTVSYEINKAEYFNYLLAVTEHLRNQMGWYTHEYILNDNRVTNLSIREVVDQYLSDNNNVIDSFNKIALITNCRYTEVLKKFSFLVLQLTDECNYIYRRNSPEDFVKCIVTLSQMFQFSQPLFQKLYDALTYISLIDVKLLLKSYENYSDYIVDELYDVKEYVFLMGRFQDSCFYDDNNNLDVEKAYNILLSVEDFFLITMSNLVGCPQKKEL